MILARPLTHTSTGKTLRHNTGIPLTLLCLTWQRSLCSLQSQLFKDPAQFPSKRAFQKFPSTDPKQPMQRARTGSEAWHGSQSCLLRRAAQCARAQLDVPWPLCYLWGEIKERAAGLCLPPALLGQTSCGSKENCRGASEARGTSRGFAGTLQVTGAQVINTVENFTSLICFEPVTSKEQLYHAEKRYPQVKMSLQSFVISAAAVMTTSVGSTVSGFPFDKYCLNRKWHFMQGEKS